MGLRALASAIQAGLQRQGIISNNIANVLTPGFRSRRAQQQNLAELEWASMWEPICGTWGFSHDITRNFTLETRP